MVGMRNSRVICAASSRGTASSTTAKAPAAFDRSRIANQLLRGNPPSFLARGIRRAHSAIAASTPRAPSPEFPLSVSREINFQAPFSPPLHLHGPPPPASFHETHGVAQRLAPGPRDSSRKACPPPAAPGAFPRAHGRGVVVQHFIDGNGKRVVVPPARPCPANRRQESPPRPASSSKPRGRIVVRRQASNFLKVGMGTRSL